MDVALDAEYDPRRMVVSDRVELRRLAIDRKGLVLWQRLKSQAADGEAIPVDDPAVVLAILRAVVGGESQQASGGRTSPDVAALFRTIERMKRSVDARATPGSPARLPDLPPDLTALPTLDLVDQLATLHLRSLGVRSGTKLSLVAFLLVGDFFHEAMELEKARSWYEEARARSMSRFPDIHQPAIYALALIDALELRLDAAEERLRAMTGAYFRVPATGLLASALLLHGEVLLRQGRFAEAMPVLLRAAATRRAPYPVRAGAVRRLSVAYRRPFSLLGDRRIPARQRLLLAAVMPAFSSRWLWNRRWAFRPGVRSVLRILLSLLETDAAAIPRRARRILIARAMGGIGDLLMATPALAALRRRFPQAEIDFAVPARFFPLFEGNRDFKLLDIDAGVSLDRYDCCVSWSDCPASRVETRTAPRVKMSRIQAFASSLGIRRLRDTRPRYVVSAEEQVFAGAFWREHGLDGQVVVAVQYRSAEPYRDYPHIDAVIRTLAARGRHVMVFHDEPLTGLAAEHVLIVDRLSFRRAAALLARCTLLVAPDSAFVHLAGALGLPAIAIYGPIDGAVRTRDYPGVEVLQERLGCVPCWRHQDMPCALTDGMDSACLAAIAPEVVLARVERRLTGGSQRDAR